MVGTGTEVNKENIGLVAALTNEQTPSYLVKTTDISFLTRYRARVQRDPFGDITMAYDLVNIESLWKERPIDEPDWVADESIEGLLASLTALYGGRLASRLRYLVDAAAEEGLALGIESFIDLAEFLKAHRQLIFPDLVLSQSGNVRAEWVAGRNRHLVVEFLGSDNCRFVLFVPNRNHNERTVRLSGYLSVDLLLSTVQSQGAVSWISRK